MSARTTYSRSTVWTTYEGRKVAIRNMDDAHLVNLIMFFQFHADHPAAAGMLPVLIEEMCKRQISNEFVKKAPFPHVDQAGNLMIWDYWEKKPVPYVGSIFQRRHETSGGSSSFEFPWILAAVIAGWLLREITRGVL